MLGASCSSESSPTAAEPAATPETTQVSIEETSDPPPTTTTPAMEPWHLVAVGDSIPFNSPEDCPGCTSFVDRYGEAITAVTGHPVDVDNLSKHTGLQVDGLLDDLECDQFGMHRPGPTSSSWASPTTTPRGAATTTRATVTNGDDIDWSKYNPTCATAAAEMFRPKYESVYAQIVALRDGKPTIFRTINRYNDWIGWAEGNVPPERRRSDPARRRRLEHDDL